jgi:hypothetical protein
MATLLADIIKFPLRGGLSDGRASKQIGERPFSKCLGLVATAVGLLQIKGLSLTTVLMSRQKPHRTIE